MPDVAKLKKKAAELELKKQFDKALAVYVEILNSYPGSGEEVDVALFNRVGDLYLKQGNVADAVGYYERAVDHYVDNGFFNNAIALCNKILRSSPGRATIYYKLGKISAHKGFKGDAKANFLEYADRMQKAGKIDEAFRALMEFADLCPDQDDIRLMLADQLTRAKRGGEAVEQLQRLYQRYVQEGRETEANATVQRMKAIEPNVVPRKGTAPPRHTGDLVFLDLNDAPSAAKSATARRATQGLDVIATGGQPGLAAGSAAGAPPQAPKPPPAAPPAAPPSAATPEPPSLLEELDLTSLDTGSFTNDPTSTLGTSGLEPAVLDGMIRSADLEGVEPTSGGLLDGLQTTGFGDDAPAADAGAMLDLEPTSFKAPAASRGPAAASADDLLDFDMPAFGSAGGLEGGGSPLQDLPLVGGGDSPPFSDDEPSIGGDLDLIMPEDAGGAGEAEPADIPLMDLELPASPAPAPPVAPPKAPLTPPPLARERAPAAKRHDPYRAKQPPEAPAPARAAAAPARRDELAPHGSTDAAVHSVEALQAMAKGRPDDHALRRRLAEAMLDAGDREGGLRELETAMVGYERANDLAGAAALADEIVHLSPDSLRHHQKRVEYAFRQNEHGRLIESYLELGDALFRSGQVEKSRAIYQRVLDLAPHDVRAQTALESFPSAEPGPAPMRSNGRAGPPPTAPRRAAPAAAAPRRGSDDEFVNLGDWLRGEEAPKDTRMVVQEQKPSGDEQADFQDMLRKFKQGIAENVEEEDHQAHYDLGVAYKEMGLTDEAIAEFQKALRAPANRVPAYEALGQCFMEKDQYPMAATILSRALSEKGVSEDQLVGVLYLLGRCAEERGQYDVALDFYQRVFVVDIQFRDVGDRLAAVEGASS